MGHRRQGGARGASNIVVAHNNFHGRTTTIISFSDDDTARRGFGLHARFRSAPFGDADALAAAIDENTVAVLLEPIQGEAGIIVPPDDFLPRVRALCTERNVLMIADEIQSGLARTGRTFACDHWGVVPDIYLLGKALGGGVVRRRRSSPTATSSTCCTPVNTARRSAVTRSRRRSARPWWGYCSAANSSHAQPSW